MRKSGFFPRLALVNLMRNGRFYGPYLLSCGMTAAMYYILSYLTFSDIVASVRGAGYLQSLMYLGRLVVTLFSAVLLLYANSFVMKRRRRELGLYNILGLEKRHTARLMVWETLYCAAAAIVGGLAAGVLLSKLVLLLLLQLSHLPVEYGFEISLSGMADTAALFGFLFLLTLVWNLFGLLRSRPVELLHSASAGEREPRTRRLLVVLGAVTLGAGYATALTVEDPFTALAYFFLAVALVMVGLGAFPPFGMFISEFLTFVAGVTAGPMWLVVVVALGLTVAISALTRIALKSVFGHAPQGMGKHEAPALMLIPEIILAVMILWFGIATPLPLVHGVETATGIVLEQSTEELHATPMYRAVFGTETAQSEVE